MMKVSIEVIPHKMQRYETAGDWWWEAVAKDHKEHVLNIRISFLGDWRYEMAIALHELVEVLVCKAKGISQKAVDTFDAQYERDRARGKYSAEQEPGDDPDSPYHLEHSVATAVERIFIFAVGASWKEYDAAVMSL